MVAYHPLIKSELPNFVHELFKTSAYFRSLVVLSVSVAVNVTFSYIL